MTRSEHGLSWAVGVIGALLALGPVLRAQAMLNLDLVLLPHAPVPAGVWGLGTELPRRTPLLLPLAWADSTIGSVAAGKVLVVLCLAGAFVGATRLAGIELPWAWAAGALYAWSPFTMTRLAVGHFFVLAAMAVLPWALPRLFDPHRDRGVTFLAALALALTGVLGGIFGGIATLLGCVGRPLREVPRTLLVVIVAQVPWLAPGLVVAARGINGASSASFPTDLGGSGGVVRLLGGQGFWQRAYQVGGQSGWWLPLVGLAVLALALIGHRDLPWWRNRAAALAAIGTALVLLSGLTATEGAYGWLTSQPGGAALREGQRLLPLLLVWLAPAAARGAVSLARRRPSVAGLEAVTLALALLLTVPGVWGAGDQLRPAAIPSGWEAARSIVRERPGSVLALPWFQYLDLEAAGGRRVLNPLPLWLGGDVLTSSDPRLPGGTGPERNDPREQAATRLVVASLRGDAIGPGLADLGVRWVVVLRDGDLVRGQSVGTVQDEVLAADGTLEQVYADDDVAVYAVSDWEDDGVDPVVSPWLRVRSDRPLELDRPWAPGWSRGAEAAVRSVNGRISVSSGDAPVLYWPAGLVLVAYFVTGAITVMAIWRHWRPSHCSITST